MKKLKQFILKIKILKINLGGVKMKRFLLRLLIIVITVLTSALLSHIEFTFAQKTVKLKYSITHGSPGMNPLADLSVAWQEEITKRSKGEITFENFWGGSLGAPAEYIELLRTGIIDAGIIFGWYTPSKMPFTNFEYVFPFGPTSYEIAIKARKKIRSEIPQFDKEFSDQNIINFIDLPQTTYNFISKEPLRSLEDFKGKKVGLIGRYFGRWLPPGSTPVVRPGHERYDMLKTGVISIDLNPLENQYIFKLYEVTSYCMTGIPILTLANIAMCMNKDSFNKLSPEQQKIISDSARSLEERAYKEILPNWEKKVYNTFKEKGLKFVEFPKSEWEKWVASLEDIPAEWAAEMESKGLPGFKTVQRWQEITSEMGFKWARKWGVRK